MALRVTQQSQTTLALTNLTESLLKRTELQKQVASGRRISNISDDPLAARSGMVNQSTLEQIEQYIRNIKSADGQLTMAESALQDVNTHLLSAHSIALDGAQDTSSKESRSAAGLQIQQILESMMNLANSKYEGNYIFAGHNNTVTPFQRVNNVVNYTGDDGTLLTNIDDGIQVAANITGGEAFNVLTAKVSGRDLNPLISFGGVGVDSTRVSALNRGEGIQAGSIKITYGPAASRSTVTLDLSKAASLADVRDMIQNATGNNVTAAVNVANGLTLTDTSFDAVEMTVEAIHSNTTAGDLGILGTSVAGVLIGTDLNPEVETGTHVSLLRNGGAAVDLIGGLAVTNGSENDTLDFSTAKTVLDLLNVINLSSANLQAEINDTGTGINIASTTSGTTLTINENTGTTAVDFGVEETTGVTSDSIFSALINLANALNSDDTSQISQAGGEIKDRIDDLISRRGEIGVRIQRLNVAENRHLDEEITVQNLLSEAVDADLAEVLTKLSTEEVIFNAILRSIASTFQPSLMEFL